MADVLQQTPNIITAWNVVTRSLDSVSSKYTNWDIPSSKDFQNAVALLHQAGALSLVRDYFISLFENDLRSFIIPSFWERFNGTYDDSYWKFPLALEDLYKHVQKYFHAIPELQSVLTEMENVPVCNNLPIKKRRNSCNQRRPVLKEMLEVLRAMLLSSFSAEFHPILADYYNIAFSVFYARQKGAPSIVQIESRYICTGCDKETSLCCCDTYLNLFHTASKQLLDLQLLEHVIGDIPISVTQDYIEKHINQTCTASFDVSYLSTLKTWLDEILIKWLSDVYVSKENSSAEDILTGYKNRLIYTLCDVYANIRLDQLFNVIIEFPESQAALEDLRECINFVQLRPKVIVSLRKMSKKRLLHPGVNTGDILTAYISCIKALKVLDSSGVILQAVCGPVSKYLRSREDTVRCIVTSLTDESCEDLASELMKGSPLVLDDNYHSDEENEDWESWTPDPVDADPAKGAKGQRTSDIISMLVNIYGSKELFVNEYRMLLADRLLGTFSYNTEREIRYLELLKLRFGEAHMHYCEVMLKDVADSKRINNHLNSGDLPTYKTGDFPVNAMILSGQFWPPFKEEKLKLPEYIWEHLVQYTAAFESLKGNRSLVWKPHLGVVHLEIELKERTLELFVSPVHATILWHFQDKDQWTIDDLSTEMQIQASVLRRKITFWQSHGILREEEPDVFLLVEEKESSVQESIMVIEEERESVTASSHDQREEELQTFWSYIVGMLTNMESLPLERIHSMLRMFAMQGPNTNEFTLQGMKQFLDKKVRERKLLFSSGLYRLPRFES